jgi:glycosyltransferase involved in cell wall biosynthesis
VNVIILTLLSMAGQRTARPAGCAPSSNPRLPMASTSTIGSFMRILIDMQGAQSESRFRGIGRYSLALALGIARNAQDHEVWLALNGALQPSIMDLRHAFAGLVPPERIRVFDIPGPVAEIDADNVPRCRAAELLREQFIAQLAPDVVLITSLFEGYIDDAVVSVGRFAPAARTAVVLYDLIPFLNPDAYLGTPEQRQHYAGKIASLRAAGLLLAISDYTRQEAIDALALDPQNVIAISTAVDACFYPAPTGPGLAALEARCGITRPAVLYAPGGFDTRKNIDGLIVAYSLLPAPLRARHQLVIASKLGEHERRIMTEHAARHGLGPDELVLTGYVSDAELINLYRSAALFVFPSKHEGFGLPALEAMACGALVIGADNTSIPEVIGCAEALFDAGAPASIAAKIAEVLGDAAMQERLRAHGQQQAARFSWDTTAQKALQALGLHHARLPATPEPDATAFPALVHAIVDVPGLPRAPAYLQELAHCLAGMPDPARPRQLLVDVSTLSDTHTGATLAALLAVPDIGLQIEPVYLSSAGGRSHYRYAPVAMLAEPGITATAPDAAIDFGPMDVLYSAGTMPPPHAAFGLRARGVRLAWLAGMDAPVDACLHVDTVLCTSAAVLARLDDWLTGHPDAPRPARAVLAPDAGPAQLLALLGASA